MNPEVDHSHRCTSGDAWRIDFREYLTNETVTDFQRDDHFFWYSETDSILAMVEVFDTELDENSVADVSFSTAEPHVYVTMFRHAPNGELVSSWFEGKLLADKTIHSDIPFSQPVRYSPIRKGVAPKVMIPGDWAGVAYHFQDTTVELPKIDSELVFIPGHQIYDFLNHKDVYAD